jgi:hypothetical protein
VAVDNPGMTTTIEASRQLVLARLGAPLPLLSGARYRYDSAQIRQIYERYGQYIDDALMGGGDPEEALDHFIAFLEGQREHDYVAFHYGRELLLDHLSVPIECPCDDPEPDEAPSESNLASPPPPRELPRWSRRKPKRREAAPLAQVRLRARVLDRLGRPYGRLPGEGIMLTRSPALGEMIAYFDDLQYRTTGEGVVDEAIERVAALRERDWQAFYYGRDELLSLLPVELELPSPVDD